MIHKLYQYNFTILQLTNYSFLFVLWEMLSCFYSSLLFSCFCFCFCFHVSCSENLGSRQYLLDQSGKHMVKNDPIELLNPLRKLFKKVAHSDSGHPHSSCLPTLHTITCPPINISRNLAHKTPYKACAKFKPWADFSKPFLMFGVILIFL